MKDKLERLIKNNLFLFFVIFSFASVFYSLRLGFSDLWSDEIYTKSMLGGSLTDFYVRFENDLHPPLYYLGLKGFTALFGTGAITLRLFSVLGVLSTIALGYFTGQSIFGKRGALYLCLMIISIPMLAAYSHQARMYTWAAFSVTGVFFYSYLFMKSGAGRDLRLLFIFTVIAMYLHYYSMAAAFVTNIFVFLYFFLTKNKKWHAHLLSMFLAAILFLPWLLMFVTQIKKVQNAFWAPGVSLSAFLSCLTIPFTEQFWTSNYSIALTVLFYSIIVIVLLLSFSKSFAEYRLVLWLSLFVFLGTLLLVTVISLFSQSILSTRYVMTIVTMLAIPPAVLFAVVRTKWLRLILISAVLLLAVRITVSVFGFSYGPYKQTIEYISDHYPGIRKVLHITEVTAGPLVEYSGNSGLCHYWLKTEMSNVDAFIEVHQFDRPDEFLRPGEEFCAVRFNNLELNIDNLELALSESDLIKKDTVFDNKLKDGIFIQLYFLKYKGRQN